MGSSPDRDGPAKRSVRAERTDRRRHARPGGRDLAHGPRAAVLGVAPRRRAPRARTAMVYPTLLAVIGDVAHPSWRATSYGVYRLWRDLGYAVGALLAGLVADWLGMPAAIHVVAALTLLSGFVVLVRMRETLARVR